MQKVRKSPVATANYAATYKNFTDARMGEANTSRFATLHKKLSQAAHSVVPVKPIFRSLHDLL